jgi:methylthioribulose-1-phosphate dehydratase
MIKHQMIDSELITLDPRIELISTARNFYEKGWMVGTGGNLSAKLLDGSFWITASGKSKGSLLPSDFVRIYPNGKKYQKFSDIRPSKETVIHQTIYELFPEAQACYHILSVKANLVSRFVQEDILALPPLEMLNKLGLMEETFHCIMPIIDNNFQASKIAANIKKLFQTEPPKISALLIRDHGVTVWAPSLEAAQNYIEAIEYIFCYMVSARELGIWNEADSIIPRSNKRINPLLQTPRRSLRYRIGS